MASFCATSEAPEGPRPAGSVAAARADFHAYRAPQVPVAALSGREKLLLLPLALRDAVYVATQDIQELAEQRPSTNSEAPHPTTPK